MRRGIAAYIAQLNGETMPKIGRNDPCPCGSGRKYKQCHGPIDTARETEQRQLRNAQETLLDKLMETAPRFAAAFPEALQRFWGGKYRVETVEELDDLEERGAQRFLTWFFFDHRNGETTPLEQITADPGDLELTAPEARLLPSWVDVRLQPYFVVDVNQGRGFTVRPLWGESEITVEDQAAARRLEPGEVLIVHLTPAGDAHLVAGVAAHLTADTVEHLGEFADLHLADLRTTQPEAGYGELIQQRSEIFNHFVMEVPREEQDTSKLQMLVDNTRVMMATAAAAVGLRRGGDEAAPRLAVPQPAGEAQEHDEG